MGNAEQAAGSGRTQVAESAITSFLKSPFAGIAPWIVMSVFSGPGRFEMAVLAALAISVAVFAASRHRGDSIKLMEIFDLLFFVAFAIVGILANKQQITWLEQWAGEIVNISLVLFVVVTILIRQPFTLQYAKEGVDPEHWNAPIFLRINYTIAWVWAGAFLWQSLMGLIEDAWAPGTAFWTGWILQIGAMIFAISFTAFYPDYATAKAIGKGPVPSPIGLVDWLPTFIIITGVAGLLSDSVNTWLGVGLIGVGVLGVNYVIYYKKTHKQEEAAATADQGG